MNFFRKNLSSAHLLFLFQFIAHLSLIYLILYGTIWHWLICFFIYFLTGCFGMSITYHRLLSHKSWKAHRWFEKVGTLLGTIGLTGSALAWVAVHRQHHAHSDKINDPHSPHIHHWWKVQFFSMYYKPNLRYARPLLRDPFIVFCHRKYFTIQLCYLAFLFLIDPQAIVYAYLAPAAILWHGGSLINTVGHNWGYRNFHLNDKSVNNPILGYLMWGEGWHNNHHAKPFAKSFKEKPWELDISSLFISILERKK